MKAVSTALQVLLEFVGERGELSVVEIAQRRGLNKSQVSKILATLRDHKLLTQDPITRRYAVGMRAFALGSRFVDTDRVARAALAVLRRLVDRTRLSAYLSVMDDREVVYLLGVEGPLFHASGWSAGTFLPFHASAASRAMVAFLPEAQLDGLIVAHGLPQLTPATITDEARFRQALQAVRQHGFAVTRGELTPGVGVIAVPVFTEHCAVAAAISLAFPMHLVPADKESDYVRILHHEARELSFRIGSPVYPYGGELSEQPVPAA